MRSMYEAAVFLLVYKFKISDYFRIVTSRTTLKDRDRFYHYFYHNTAGEYSKYDVGSIISSFYALTAQNSVTARARVPSSREF